MIDIHTLKQSEYEDFVSLWGASFGDGPEVYETIRGELGTCWKDFVLLSDGGGSSDGSGKSIVAALSQFEYGKLKGAELPPLTVLVSYAISTAETARGRGFGSAITKYARDASRALGALSMLCPANEGLIAFYSELDYAPHCYACEFTVDAAGRMQGAISPAAGGSDRGYAPARDLQLKKIDAAAYNELRERYLAGREHVELIPPVLKFIEKSSMGFYEVLLEKEEISCRAVAVLEGDVQISVSEMITERGSGGDAGDASSIAAALCERFEQEEIIIRIPANAGTPGRYVQAMLALPQGSPHGGEAVRGLHPYFGFPFD